MRTDKEILEDYLVLCKRYKVQPIHLMTDYRWQLHYDQLRKRRNRERSK